MPEGLVADLSLEGKAFVSLVAFDFLDTRVFGIKWPGFCNFPEINLRFYVCSMADTQERGVVFIRELVPRFLIAFLAKLIYNEPYQSCPMQSRSCLKDKSATLLTKHEIIYKGKRQSIEIETEPDSCLPEENSCEHFFKEHRWGFGKTRAGKTLRYEVEHPLWRVQKVLSYKLDFDFAHVYGEDFAFLNGRKPYSVIFAEGSQISVFPASPIEPPA